MSMQSYVTRRKFLRLSALGSSAILAACAPKVVTETVVVEKVVKETVVQEKIVKEAVEVEKEVTRVVEKQVEVAPATKEITLTLAIRAGNELSEPAVYITRPKEFTEETGIKVELVGIPGGEFMAKFEVMAVSGTLTDNVFFTQASWHHSRMVYFGTLLSMNDWMDSAGVSSDEWIPAGIDTCTYDGHVYGMPRIAHPAEAYIFLNHDLFEEAGIPIPELDLDAEMQGQAMTWDELWELGTKLSKGPTNARDVYGFYPVTTNSQAVVNGIRSFGGWELNEAGTEHPVDDAWKDYVRWTYNALTQDKISPHATELGAGGIYGLFAAGRLAIMQSGCWYYPAVDEAVGPPDGSGLFSWSFVGLPQGPSFNGWGCSASGHAPTRQTQHPIEACMLQYAMADARMAYHVANEHRYLVGRTNELEEIGSPLNEDPFIQLQWVHFNRQFPYIVGRNFRGEEWRAALTNTLDEIYLGVRQPDDAFFAYMKDSLDDILQRPIA